MTRNEILILLHARILSFTCESGPFADRRGVVRPLRPPLVTGLLNDPTPILPEFSGCSLGLDCRCCGSEERRIRFRMHTSTEHQLHRQTDGRTDGGLTAKARDYIVKTTSNSNKNCDRKTVRVTTGGRESPDDTIVTYTDSREKDVSRV